MDNTRTRNWRQTHTSETEGLSFQPLPCPGPECGRHGDGKLNVGGEGEEGKGRRAGASYAASGPAQRDSVRAWGRWGEAGLQDRGQGARGRGC